MALTHDEILRLGRAAGENTATGAFQRIEQTLTTYRIRHDMSESDVAEMRDAAKEAFAAAVAEEVGGSNT